MFSLISHKHEYVCNADEAEDIVQETFLRLVRRAQWEGRPDNPAAWLFTVVVVRNEAMQTLTLPTELLPELYGVEALLATATPQMDVAARERMKAIALLETCRLTQPELPDLVETIVDSGEQGITISLRRYVKMERFQAMALGIVFGLVIGAIFNLVIVVSGK